MPSSRSHRLLAHEIRKIIEGKTGYRTLRISERDGFTIFMVENDKRTIIWIRESPITQKALNLFNKIIRKYEHDNIIIFRTNDTPNTIRLPQNYIIIYNNINELIEKLLY